MKNIIILLAILKSALCASIDGSTSAVDYRSPFALKLQNELRQVFSVVCESPGLTCGSDCVSVYLCTKTESGFKPELAETCGDGTTCSAGTCSTIPSHECSPGAKFPFVCSSIDGVYPDPVDCKKYHYCVPENSSNLKLTHYNASCTSNYGYNPITTYCDIPLPNGNCGEYIVPVCEKPAQTGAVGGNPSVYYICLPYNNNQPKILYPFIYTCEHGKVYNGKYKCEDPKKPTI